jgi:hypothetical protein
MSEVGGHYGKLTEPVLALAMESCWLLAALLLFSQLVAEGRQVSAMFLWPVYLLAFGLNWALLRRGTKTYVRGSTNVAAVILAVLLVTKVQLYAGYPLLDGLWLREALGHLGRLFLAFQGEFFIVVAVILLFWRGRHLAERGATFSSLGGNFQFGLTMLLCVMLVAHLVEVDVPGITPLTAGFCGLSFVALGLARRDAGARDSARTQIGQLLLATVALILVTGTLLGSVVDADLLRLLVRAVTWAAGLIGQFMAWLASLLPQPEFLQPEPQGGEMPGFPEPESFNPWRIPEPIRDALGKVTMGGMFALMLFALYRLLSDIFARMRTPGGVTVERLPGGLRAELRGLVQWLLRQPARLLHLYRRVIGKRGQPGEETVSSLRQVYRRLLRWGAAAGWPRRPSQTAYEYEQVLAEVAPVEVQADLSYITHAYVRGRYGGKAPGDEAIEEARLCWERVRRFKLRRRVHSA